MTLLEQIEGHWTKEALDYKWPNGPNSLVIMKIRSGRRQRNSMSGNISVFTCCYMGNESNSIFFVTLPRPGRGKSRCERP